VQFIQFNGLQNSDAHRFCGIRLVGSHKIVYRNSSVRLLVMYNKNRSISVRTLFAIQQFHIKYVSVIKLLRAYFKNVYRVHVSRNKLHVFLFVWLRIPNVTRHVWAYIFSKLYTVVFRRFWIAFTHDRTRKKNRSWSFNLN